MEIEVKKEDKNEIEFVLKGEGHTFARLLVNKLLEDKAVEVAQYDVPHPLVGNPVFFVRTSKGKPRAALKDAAKELKKEIKGLL